MKDKYMTVWKGKKKKKKDSNMNLSSLKNYSGKEHKWNK